MENENVCGEIILDKKIELIRCKCVFIKKGDILLFDIVNCEIYRGKNFLIWGENGLGKFILIKFLVRLDDDYRG